MRITENLQEHISELNSKIFSQTSTYFGCTLAAASSLNCCWSIIKLRTALVHNIFRLVNTMEQQIIPSTKRFHIVCLCVNCYKFRLEFLVISLKRFYIQSLFNLLLLQRVNFLLVLITLGKQFPCFSSSITDLFS